MQLRPETLPTRTAPSRRPRMSEPEWERWTSRAFDLMAIGLGATLIVVLWIAIICGIIDVATK